MSHEHGGGEEAIKKTNIEAQEYNEQKRLPLAKTAIELTQIEEELETLPAGITYEETDRAYRQLLQLPEDILDMKLGVIDSKLRDNNNRTLSLEADRNRLLNERLLVLNILNERFWSGK